MYVCLHRVLRLKNGNAPASGGTTVHDTRTSAPESCLHLDVGARRGAESEDGVITRSARLVTDDGLSDESDPTE